MSDPAAAGRPFDGLAALAAAASPPELWHELLLHEPRRFPADPQDAVAAFCRVHSAGEPDATVTALLLLTAWRWRRCTAALLSRILASGLLDDHDLDELAEVGLFHDKANFVLPDAVLSRPVRPPLRRWAAGHLLRHDPARLADVRERLCRLDPRAAAAVMRGVLDVLDSLPTEAAECLLGEARQWPHQSVRRPALQRIADRGDGAEAVRLAEADPDATIRAAAARLVGPATRSPATLF